VQCHATPCDFVFTTVTATVMQSDCNYTNKHVHFSAKLHEVAANHNAGIGMGVVDQLWGHCLHLLFSRVSVHYLKAIYCLQSHFSYVDFICYGT